MLTPKQIQEQRIKRAQLKKQRVERSKVEQLDGSIIEDSTPNSLKLRGQQRIGSLLIKQARKISKFVIPQLLQITQQYALDKFKEQQNNISTEELKQQFCSPQLPQLIEQRNKLTDYLNNTGQKLDSLSITIEFGSTFASLLQGIITGLKTAKTTANIAMSFIPVGLPGAVPSVINTVGDIADNATFNADGSPKLPPLTITASQVSPAVAMVQNVILKSVNQLSIIDQLILLCDPYANLNPLSDSILETANISKLAEQTENQTTYKGFILEIETKEYTKRVNQNRAVGKNKDGIVMISTPYSFASDPQILIEELKYIIDKDDLKAY